MKTNKTNDIVNNYDTLSAIWIMACNDEGSQITYEGVNYRLGLTDDNYIRNLVEDHGELFRRRTTLKQLEEWRKKMLLGKKLPSWLMNIKDTDKRNEKIRDLNIDDVFRSQFRAEPNSPRSEIEIIDWGLQHIDRLRKAELESKQERTRIFSSIWLPILSTFVAVIAVVSSFYVQYTSNNNQTFLKHYEVELKPKQEGYANFMKSISSSFYDAQDNNSVLMYQSLDRAESYFYVLEPFLNSNDRERIWEQFQQFSGFCSTVLKADIANKASLKMVDSFIWYKKYFRTNLYNALFIIENNSLRSPSAAANL